MIAGRWNAAAFTRALTASLRARKRNRQTGSPDKDAARWRRADWLWPDFTPRYED